MQRGCPSVRPFSNVSGTYSRLAQDLLNTCSELELHKFPLVIFKELILLLLLLLLLRAKGALAPVVSLQQVDREALLIHFS